ncbi:MAG: UDP-N-acetylmuramate dehydrogenase [Deltaproteobacteria bacterium]|nr:UDP-N-acetylmuramate dehydrogenase [Deltaproteobacteria bacterium]
MDCRVARGASETFYAEHFMAEPTENSAATALGAELALVAGLRVKFDEPLARYTSMKIGGPADCFVEVETIAAMRALLPLLRLHQARITFLGNGSNVLVSDRGVRGVVVRLTGEFKKVEWRDEENHVRVHVGAACAITQLVREAARKGYAGLEFAEGIPGTMGGALVMNAGAYGSEFEKIVAQVDGVLPDGSDARFARAELNFSYRTSNLPAGMVVTAVHLRLAKDEASRVSAKLKELVTKRKTSQPAGFPNSGSMFRNPPGDFAGRLIEAAGLKGSRVGQAQISERHANFIVNLGGAKAAEVNQLMEQAKAAVAEKFGVQLEAEVRLLGDWA